MQQCNHSYIIDLTLFPIAKDRSHGSDRILDHFQYWCYSLLVLAASASPKLESIIACPAPYLDADLRFYYFAPFIGIVLLVGSLATYSCKRYALIAFTVRLAKAMIDPQPRDGCRLASATDNEHRSTVVRGTSIGDVPTRYTIFGLEPYELPVIGTYVDPRIVPGFEYRVRTAGNPRKHLFRGRALRLISIGAGYGKRIMFTSDKLNDPENFFWSDTHPDGLGFELRAVRVGQKFAICVDGLRVGEATVCKDDNPQVEEQQEKIKTDGGTKIIKYVYVDVTCQLSMEMDPLPRCNTKYKTMQVSGTAVLSQMFHHCSADLLRIQNIRLNTQLKTIVTQQVEITFLPF